MRLFRLGLRARLYLGFAVLAVIGLGLAGFGMLGLSRVAGTVTTMEEISEQVIRVQEMNRLLEVIRRAANRYRLDADKTNLAAMKQAEASAEAMMNDAVSGARSEERREAYRDLAARLRDVTTVADAFVNDFDQGFAERDKLFAGGDALTAVTGRMVEAARAGDDAAQAAAAGRAESAILLVRVANWRFLATFDPKGPQTFKANAEKAAAALGALERVATGDAKPLIAPVRDALAAYTASFDGASKNLIAGAGRLTDVLLPKTIALQQAAGTALARLHETFNTNAVSSRAEAGQAMWLQAVVAGVAAVAGGVLAFLIGRSIVGPVASMTAAMTRLASGDNAVEVPARENADEIGAMARAVEVFKQNAIENARMAEAKIKEQAARDRRQAAMDGHTQNFGNSISGVMGSLGQSAGNLHTAAQDMSQAAQRTRTSTSEAVQGADASARDLNSVAVAAEEMAASIHEISRQVAHVTTAVGAAVQRASETDRKVAGLADTADRIGDVVRLINDIAGQTNLLALNATIEAARAGEAGKGFAVVASEVKTLATQTARATDQIGAQIVAIRTSTGEAVDAVRDVGHAIAEVSSVATAIAAAVEQQAAATQEISASVQTVTKATTAAAEAMQQVLGIAEETDSASRSVLAAAEEVGTTSSTLRDEVTEFLAAVKRDNGEDRRMYERVPGGGALVSLTLPGAAAMDLPIKDISRGGVALICNTRSPIGTEVKIGLPADGTVTGRVARCDDGLLTVVFRQDQVMMQQIDRALEAIRRRGRPAAA